MYVYTKAESIISILISKSVKNGVERHLYFIFSIFFASEGPIYLYTQPNEGTCVGYQTTNKLPVC